MRSVALTVIEQKNADSNSSHTLFIKKVKCIGGVSSFETPFILYLHLNIQSIYTQVLERHNYYGRKLVFCNSHYSSYVEERVKNTSSFAGGGASLLLTLNFEYFQNTGAKILFYFETAK